MEKVPPQMRLSATIRTLREELKISQESFADKIAMHRAYYSSIERGERNVTLETLLRVAAGLRTDVATIARKAKI
jgi:transcriptional regulator with XRE-family HTH domain